MKRIILFLLLIVFSNQTTNASDKPEPIAMRTRSKTTAKAQTINASDKPVRKRKNQVTASETKKDTQKKRKKKKENDNTPVEKCPICRDACKKGHAVFQHCDKKNKMHVRCLWGWIKDKDKPTCPLCAQNLEKEEVDVITKKGEKLKAKINAKLISIVKGKNLKRVKKQLKIIAEKIFLPLSFLLENSTAETIFEFLIEQNDLTEAFYFLQNCIKNCMQAKTEAWNIFFTWLTKNKDRLKVTQEENPQEEVVIEEDLQQEVPQQEVLQDFFIKAAAINNIETILLFLNDEDLYKDLEEGKTIINAFTKALEAGHAECITEFLKHEKTQETIKSFKFVLQIRLSLFPGMMIMKNLSYPIIDFILMENMKKDNNQAISNIIRLMIENEDLMKLSTTETRMDVFSHIVKHNLENVAKLMITNNKIKQELIAEKKIHPALITATIKNNSNIIKELFSHDDIVKNLNERKNLVTIALGIAYSLNNESICKLIEEKCNMSKSEESIKKVFDFAMRLQKNELNELVEKIIEKAQKDFAESFEEILSLSRLTEEEIIDALTYAAKSDFLAIIKINLKNDVIRKNLTSKTLKKIITESALTNKHKIIQEFYAYDDIMKNLVEGKNFAHTFIHTLLGCAYVLEHKETLEVLEKKATFSQESLKEAFIFAIQNKNDDLAKKIIEKIKKEYSDSFEKIVSLAYGYDLLDTINIFLPPTLKFELLALKQRYIKELTNIDFNERHAINNVFLDALQAKQFKFLQGTIIKAFTYILTQETINQAFMDAVKNNYIEDSLVLIFEKQGIKDKVLEKTVLEALQHLKQTAPGSNAHKAVQSFYEQQFNTKN